MALWSLSRLHHGMPRSQAHPEVMQGTAEGPPPSAAAHLPEAAAVFDAATALDTATDMVDPQLRLVELLVRHGLLPRAFLPQIQINSHVLRVMAQVVGRAAEGSGDGTRAA
jgi:hypothetical protein